MSNPVNDPIGTGINPLSDNEAALKRGPRQANLHDSVEQAIPRTASRETFPLSFRQQRSWFLDQLEPSGSSSGILQAFRMDGILKVETLRQAVDAIVSRHWSLRTAFATVEGEPVQIIAKGGSVFPKVRVIDSWPGCEHEEEVLRLGTEEIQRPYDLTRGPLVRVGLVQLTEKQHILLIAMHPIISDQRSMKVFLKELSTLYEAISVGGSSPLAELPIQYADYVVWQEGWLQAEASQKQLSYWMQQLQGVPGLLELPTDKPRPPIQTYHGARHLKPIPKSLTASLNEVSRREGTTLFITLLTAFQVLLSRYTGEEDIVVGRSVEGRRQVQTEELIGPFINLLALRTILSGNPSFRELLRRVREVTEGAYANQDVPFEMLVEELQPQRSLSHAPLFQVMFELQSDQKQTLELPGLELSSIEIENGRAETDLTLIVMEEGEDLTVCFEYNTDLFDEATIARMGWHYQTLLGGVAANPEEHLASLPLLTGTERHQIMVEWNNNRTEYSRDSCVHQLFETQVKHTPDKVAVECEDQQLTYTELNRKANQLARCLIRHGVGPEVLVGICMKRSIEMLVGLLGILKAGGAYVPLDPTYPPDRLSLMLEDSEVSVLLTQEQVLKDLSLHRAQAICLDASWEAFAREDEENVASGSEAENLAYVIYTSGSTGRPKGVAIQHRSSAAFLYWAGKFFGRGQLDGVLASTSICFDLSVFELFVPLSWGGKVILTENVLHLLDSPTAKEVSLINTVPSAMAEIVRVQGLPDSVRTVNLAGEPLQHKLAQQIYQESMVQQVFNLYGPTEDTTYSTFALVRRGDGKPPSIGRPVDNTSVYVLDRHLQPVPVGVVGELHIGGDGLARGYLNHPELTAEKFIPNPFDEAGGARLYKTGDLARYLADGNIEFLGRRDKQVKLRGYRIELGEIETVLAGLPGIRESVVVVTDDELAEKVLVAYVVSELGQTSKSSELREMLKQKLPEYMVPSAFVILDELPLTPNGKVDRKALPPPHASPEPVSGLAAPRTPTEEVLAEIWCEVLRLKRVGIQDNFFELGGHSLLATRVMSRAREAFQVEIPLRVLFEIPTIEGLALAIAGTTAAKLSPGDRSGLLSRSPWSPAPREADTALPLSFAQQRLWFFDQLEPGSSAYNVPAVFRLNGFLHHPALERSLSEIVRRHEALRTVFRSVNGNPVQVVTPANELALRVMDLEAIPIVEREIKSRQLVDTELNRPFDLSTDCMLRACLLRLGQAEHILVLTLHHIASDEWSLVILLEELATLYKAYSAGKASPLAELPIQYADFSLWQRQRMQGEALESELAYWTKQLQGNLPMIELPVDHTRTTMGASRGARESILLPKSIADSLNALGQQEHTTLFTTLLAAFSAVLHRYTAQTDFVIGSPIAGRNSLDTEKLIGFFLNTLPLRADLSGNPSFRELVTRLRPVVVEAISHQDLPFERLVEELQPERTLSHSPIFQVMLNLLNLPDTKLELDGLGVEPLPSAELDAKFDLTLYARETQQGLQLDLVYATDLFEEATMRQFAGSLLALLSGVAANPDQRLSRLPILDEAERDRLASQHNIVRPWNSFVLFRKEEIELSIHARFEDQVKQHPSRIAVKTRRYQWTYAELNREANRVRQALVRIRGQGEERIALLLGHDAPMIAALLGVLKSGKAYVPLDPSYPNERLLYMLQDSQASAVVSNSETRELANQLAQDRMPIIQLDDLPDLPIDQDSGTAVRADTVAYVLYTSGSTGQPKGVVQKHRNVLHHIRNYTNNLQINAEDRLTLLSSYGFDAAVMDIYGALLNGATLCLFDLKEQGWNDLAGWLKTQEITVYHSTPTVYRYFLGTLHDTEMFPNMRLVVLGGEEVVKQDVELYRRHFTKDCIFVNGLGPTESTLALQYFINVETKTIRNSVPVGYPVEGTEILLLNEDGEDAVVYGEIAIRSAYLATGYWRKPEITSKAFLPDPEGYDRRVYRTGDMGRLLPNGSVEFAGRKDFQIKLRGFRIELEEIETALSQHPVVRQAVVMMREDEPGEKRLAAYVVPKQGQTSTGSELRSFLRQKLPDYMVPSSFVFLDGLPLTPNGKVDRKALSAHASKRTELGSDFVSPRTLTEELVAGIWCQLLGLSQIGVQDNFFELGGHSLLATQVMSRVRETFRVELPLRALFEAPTVAGLADAMEIVQQGEQGWSAPPILPVPREGHLPLSFAQQRLWFLDQLEPGSGWYNMTLAARLRGELDVGTLESALAEVVRRHEALRTRFFMKGGEPVQVVGEIWKTELAVDDLREWDVRKREEETKRLLKEESARGFDLSRDLMLRGKLIREAEQQWVLVLAIHHIASDAWSEAILCRELNVLYEAFRRQKESPLEDLKIQYADYAMWQREWLQGQVLEKQLRYWKGQLAGVPQVLELPGDRPRPVVQRHRGARQPFRLTKDLTNRLRTLSRTEGVTLFMSLLAAFQTLLYRYSGQEHIIVGTPIAGRNRGELEELIGFFVNTLSLQTDLSGNPSFRELLKRVKKVALGAYEHQDFPFDKLVEELLTKRDLSRNPLVQVMFVLQSVPRSTLELKGLTVEMVEIENTTSKFDLTLSVSEKAEGVEGVWAYDADLFESSTIRRMGRHFQTLLESVVSDPAERIANFQLDQTNGRTGSPGAEISRRHENCQTIFDMLREQIAQKPGVPSILAPGRPPLSYVGLGDMVQKTIQTLKKLGVGKRDRVALVLPNGPEVAVAFLSVACCSACAPLNPSYRASEFEFYFTDLHVKTVILQGDVESPARSAAASCGIPVIELLPDSAASAGTFQLSGNSVGSECDDGLAQADDIALVLHTSGTTSRPKIVPLTHKNLSASAQQIQKTLDLAPDDRCLNVMPLFHIHGLLAAVLASLAAGGSVVCTPGFNAPLFFDWLDTFKPTWYTAVPTMHQAILARASSQQLGLGEGQLRFIRSSSAALPPQVMRDLEKLFKAPVLEAYGMTEASHQMASNSLPPLPRKPGSVGVAAGPAVAIMDEKGNLLSAGEKGEIVIQGASVMRGYENNPEANANSFTRDWFRTGDQGYLDRDRYLFITGRLKELINRGGEKISPSEIDEALMEHPGILQAVAFAIPDSKLGEEVAAAVVLRPGVRLPGREIREWAASRLADFKVPRRVVILDEIPKGPTGKLQRIGLAEKLGLGSSLLDRPRPEYAAPRSHLEQRLIELWGEVLRIDQIGVNDSFLDIGGDSILAALLLSRIRNEFGVEISLLEFFDMRTPAEMSSVLAHHLGQSGTDEFSRQLAEVAELSDEEAERILAQELQQESEPKA